MLMHTTSHVPPATMPKLPRSCGVCLRCFACTLTDPARCCALGLRLYQRIRSSPRRLEPPVAPGCCCCLSWPSSHSMPPAPALPCRPSPTTSAPRRASGLEKLNFSEEHG